MWGTVSNAFELTLYKVKKGLGSEVIIGAENKDGIGPLTSFMPLQFLGGVRWRPMAMEN